MTYRGRVQNGVIVLEGNPPLEEGMAVRVDTEREPQTATEPEPATLAKELEDFAGIFEGPPDLAENHDHYIHGTPKRK